MTELRLSVAARADLQAVQDEGVEGFGVAAARKHMAGFDHVFALLREHPFAGRQRPELGATLRSFSHRPHVVLYVVDEQRVTIARILHHRRDLRAALSESM
jgi:toxin ParE1/3/4